MITALRFPLGPLHQPVSRHFFKNLPPSSPRRARALFLRTRLGRRQADLQPAGTEDHVLAGVVGAPALGEADLDGVGVLRAEARVPQPLVAGGGGEVEDEDGGGGRDAVDAVDGGGGGGRGVEGRGADEDGLLGAVVEPNLAADGVVVELDAWERKKLQVKDVRGPDQVMEACVSFEEKLYSR